MNKIISKIAVIIISVITLMVVLLVSISVIDYISHCSNVLPHDFPNSEWLSADGKVTFKIENNNGIGTVTKNDENFTIHVAGDGDGMYALEYISEDIGGDQYQFWAIRSINEYEFTIKVYQKHETVTIFEDGSTVTFYRVDNAPKTE